MLIGYVVVVRVGTNSIIITTEKLACEPKKKERQTKIFLTAQTIKYRENISLEKSFGYFIAK